jgi:O-antigen/teichoic acid export membrane protein
MVSATSFQPRVPDTGAPSDHTPFSRAAAADRFRNGLWQMVLGQAVISLTPLLLVPLFLRAWGPNTYGRWLSLTALVSYLSLLDLGGQTFIGNLVAMDFAKGDSEGMRAKLSEGLSLFLAIAMAAFAAILMSAAFLPSLGLLGKRIVLQSNDWAILLLMSGAVLLGIPGGIYAVAYRSVGLFSRGTAIGTYSRLGGFICGATALLFAFGPVVYASLYAACGVVTTVIVVLDASHRITACRSLRISLTAARAGLSHLTGSLLFWLMTVANAVNQQGVILVLAALSGPTAVVTFVTHRMIAGGLGYVPNIFQGPALPEMTFLFARKNMEGLAQLTRVTLKTIVLVSSLLGLLAWLVVPVVYRTWTSHRVALDMRLLALLLVQAILASAWTTSAWSLIAANRPKSLAYWNTGNAFITIVLAVVLVPRYGVYGAAIASLLGDVVCGLLVYPALSRRLCRCSVSEMFGSAASPLLVVCGIGIPVLMVRRFLGVWQFSLLVALSVTVVLLLSSLFVYNKGERHWIRLEVLRLCGI